MFRTTLYKTLFFLLLLASTAMSMATDFRPMVKAFPLLPQLPSNTVNSLFQDRQGLMWIGTDDGFCIYDGYRLQTFRSNPNRPTLLTDNKVLSIAENDDYYFFGTKKGVCVMDKRTHRVKGTPFAELNGDEVRVMVTDSRGDVWIGTYTRLVRLSGDLSKCERYDRKGVPVTSVNYIYRDNEGTIWVSFWTQGLYRYNPSADRFYKVGHLGLTDNPFRICQLRNGDYIISTWGEGIFLMRKKRDRLYSYTKISVNGKENKEKFKNIFGMVEDDDTGSLWMVGSKGLVVGKLQGTQATLMDSPGLQEKVRGRLLSIYKDRDGLVWLASQGAGVYLIGMSTPSVSMLGFPEIQRRMNRDVTFGAFSLSRTGGMWISQLDLGLGFYTRTGRLMMARDVLPPSEFENLHLSNVSTIIEPSFLKNKVWVGTTFYNKMVELERRGDSFVCTNVFDLLSGINLPTLLYEDKRNNVWIATMFDLLVKPFGEDIVKVNLNLKDVSAIAACADGTVWVGSSNYGLVKFVPRKEKGRMGVMSKQTFTTANSPLTTNHIAAVCADDKNRRVWIATSEGMILTYDLLSGKFIDMTPVFESFIANEVLNIVIDRFGYVWISTIKKLLKYDPHSKAVTAYSPDVDWSVKAFTKNNVCVDPISGQPYFGGVGGVVSVDGRKPLYIYNNVHDPMVSDVKVGGVSIYQGRLEADSYSLDSEKKRIVVGSDARNIEVDFSSYYYYNQGNIVYAYKLEGVDRDWNYTAPNHTYAYYNDLSKGTYKLLIRSTDANGRWVGHVVTYQLSRLPAFYETWWAYLFYLFCAIAFGYTLYRRAKARIKLREELRIAQIEKQKEDELTQTKLRYFTNVSHDFLTPITVISCIIDDMKMTYDTRLPQLDRIMANLRKLKQLIQQVLDFRKMENGGMELQVSQGDLRAFIVKVCDEYLEPMMQKKGIVFNFTSTLSRLPAWFDADKMEKILINLLSNAYKYTERGKIEVELKADDHFATISVSDTGKGMSQEECDHIFKRFYTVKSQSESNGIGLSLVHDLVELHHATISVKSRPGVGTCFTLVVPIAFDDYAGSERAENRDVAEMTDTDTATRELHEAAETNEADNQTMLIVEDNEELRHLMVGIFQRYHRVEEAANGEEALRKISENQPDIIISDVMMPVMDGLELCRKLKNDIDTSHIPVILLTARSAASDRVECYNAGANGYIAKPFELSVLKARIDNFLRQKSQRQQEFKEDKQTEPEKLEMSPLDKRFIDDCIVLIDECLADENFDVNQMAEKMCMSKSSLYRKIKSLSGLSPIEFIRNIRLKRAYQLLSEGELNVTEVAYRCGFSTPRYFSTCFKAEFGTTPTDFKKGAQN